jgi:serine/threonine-protein kinase
MTDRFREQVQEAIAPAYVVDRELKGGGMSRVFVAIEQALGRSVVVKVLRPDLAADVNRERFRREIMLAAKLQHPHIVPVLNAGERGDLLWYSMPFVEGESLREAILRRGQFPVRDVVRVMHDVLDALAYAHARGVVHRDIKPGNILTHGSHALVTDFGVAKALSAAMPHSGTTSAGMAIGTPAYMAPEQLAADPNADHRVDLYAAGLLAYELLTGEQPFAEQSPAETMAALLTRMPPPIEERRADVPPALASVVARLLAKKPNERPASAEETLAEIDALVTPQGGGIMSTATAAPRAATTAGARQHVSGAGVTAAPPSRRWLAPLIGLAAVAAAAVVWLATRPAVPATPNELPVAQVSVSESVKGPVPPQPTPSTNPPATPSDSSRRPVSADKAVPRDSARTVSVPAPRPRDTSAARTTTGGSTGTARRSAANLPSRSTTTSRGVTPLLTASGKPKRVAVLPVRDATPQTQYATLARALEDSLKSAATAAGYTLATDAELVRLLAERDPNAQRRLAEASGIGAMIVGFLTTRERELQAQAVITDVWRHAQTAARSGTELNDPNGSLIVVRDVMRALNRVSWRTREDPKRIIIFDIDNASGVDSLNAIGRTFADSFRTAALRQLGAGSQAIADSAARATRDAGERRVIAVQLGAGAVIAASFNRRGQDSLRVRLSVRDMSEDRQFDVVEAMAPLSDPFVVMPTLLMRLAADLGRVNWGPKGMAVPPNGN